MKHDYINYQSPASKNLKNFIDVETNMNKLNSKSIQRNIQQLIHIIVHIYLMVYLKHPFMIKILKLNYLLIKMV